MDLDLDLERESTAERTVDARVREVRVRRVVMKGGERVVVLKALQEVEDEEVGRAGRRVDSLREKAVLGRASICTSLAWSDILLLAVSAKTTWNGHPRRLKETEEAQRCQTEVLTTSPGRTFRS